MNCLHSKLPPPVENILPTRQVTARYVVNMNKGMCLYVSVYVCESTTAKVGQCAGQPEHTHAGVATEGGREGGSEGGMVRRGRTLAAMGRCGSVAACTHCKRGSWALTSAQTRYTENISFNTLPHTTLKYTPPHPQPQPQRRISFPRSISPHGPTRYV